MLGNTISSSESQYQKYVKYDDITNTADTKISQKICMAQTATQYLFNFVDFVYYNFHIFKGFASIIKQEYYDFPEHFRWEVRLSM